jgi:type I site-specific restriction endonuclease
MNEAETRAELIDPALKAAGWGVVEGSRILREYRITAGRIEGHGRRGKADIADYVLVYRNTKLGVVEAKADGDRHGGRTPHMSPHRTINILTSGDHAWNVWTRAPRG